MKLEDALKNLVNNKSIKTYAQAETYVIPLFNATDGTLVGKISVNSLGASSSESSPSGGSSPTTPYEINIGQQLFYTASDNVRTFTITADNLLLRLNSAWDSDKLPILKATVTGDFGSMNISIPMYKYSTNIFTGAASAETGEFECYVSSSSQTITYTIGNYYYGQVGGYDE